MLNKSQSNSLNDFDYISIHPIVFIPLHPYRYLNRMFIFLRISIVMLEVQTICLKVLHPYDS
jgi:hypothetical protein